MADVKAEKDGLGERLRMAFQHVLFLGTGDPAASEWYAQELARVAVAEVRRGGGLDPHAESGACGESGPREATSACVRHANHSRHHRDDEGGDWR